MHPISGRQLNASEPILIQITLYTRFRKMYSTESLREERPQKKTDPLNENGVKL